MTIPIENFQPAFGPEDFSDQLTYVNEKVVGWKACKNHSLISEDFLQRALIVIKESSFAIITAYRRRHANSGVIYTKQENIERNRKLRAFLNQNCMGVHQLVGHWPEMQVNGKCEDVVERSYLVEKPDDMSDEEFADVICGCLTIDGEIQDAALIRFKSKGDAIWLMTPEKEFRKIGDHLSFTNIGDIYSQHVKKMNMPFKFEGEEIPNCQAGAISFKQLGFQI